MALSESVGPPVTDEVLWQLFSRAEELGLRMERTHSGMVWESMPGLRHQELAVAIYSGIGPKSQAMDCECYRALDVYIRFPSGIVKRPDVSIFCRRPENDEGFVYSVPKAVIEITSPESIVKDLVDGPPLYAENGVRDVLVYDRTNNAIHHWSPSAFALHSLPYTATLQCGCQVKF